MGACHTCECATCFILIVISLLLKLLAKNLSCWGIDPTPPKLKVCYIICCINRTSVSSCPGRKERHSPLVLVTWQMVFHSLEKNRKERYIYKLHQALY